MKKQKNGLYRTKVRIGYDSDGRPIDKWISAKTKAEMEDKKRAVVAGFISGYSPRAIPLFGKAVVDWFETYRRPFVSDSHVRLYRSLINNRLVPCLGNKKITAVTADDFQTILNGMEGMSQPAITLMLSIMREVIHKAIADGYIVRDITLGLVHPKFPRAKEKRVLTPEERALLESLAVDRPWLAILYYTGMRNGEMRALTWSDIDLKGRSISINKALDSRGKMTGGKTANALRKVPISDQLAAILQRFAGMPNVLVTGDIWSSTKLSRRFEKLGLPEDITPHCLRHNFITMCWEAGVDVVITSKIVGHSSPMITLGIYTHLESSDYTDTVTSVFGELRKSCTAKNNMREKA